ncbi:MAG: OmpA family protein [Deltaproteobacteria bacterium]|nr:MAG: OmpA family protein [Deltaproteobacteria bacterium]
MIAMWLTLMALAQDGDVELPTMNVQTFRPSIDSQRTLWTDDSGLLNAGPSARMVLSYQRDPLVLREEGSFSGMLKDVAQADLIAAYSLGRFRVGGYVPVYGFARGESVGQVAGLGDVAVDLRATLVSRDKGPVGMALAARGSFPTATIDAPLGLAGLGYEVSAIVDGDVGPLLLAANLGARFTPEVDLPNVLMGPGAVARLGAGWAVTESFGLSLDVGGQVPFSSFETMAGAPIEAILGGWGALGAGWSVRGGVGRGLTTGIGAPTARALLMVSWQAERGKDSDGDGIPDKLDRCPHEAEDFDGWQDEDGCPEHTTSVTLAVVDPEERVIAQAQVQHEGQEWSTSAGRITVDLPHGERSLNVISEGFEPLTATLRVPSGPPIHEVLVLQPKPVAQGMLELVVTDLEGNPLDGSVRVGVDDAQDFSAGSAELRLDLGEHSITVKSQGFAPASFPVVAERDVANAMQVQLRPIKAKVAQDRIEIVEKVFFDTALASIKEQSYGVLDDVATILLDNEEIRLVRIEGHTDSRGGREYNFDLSRRRASSVRDYLISKGVDPMRLSSEGFGPSRPLDPGETSDAWERNRRVEFVIVKQQP